MTMNQYENFTSLPPNEEQTFVVYERRSVETGKKAMTLALIISAILGVITIIVVFSFDKPKNLMADDDMGMMSGSTSFDDDEEKKTAAPDPEPEPEPAAEGDEAAAEGGEAAAEGGEAAAEAEETE
jgi:cytoskeletal protein RodZ